jgi:hypothetical protein
MSSQTARLGRDPEYRSPTQYDLRTSTLRIEFHRCHSTLWGPAVIHQSVICLSATYDIEAARIAYRIHPQLS